MRNEYNEQFNPVVSISSVVSTGPTTAPSVPELVEGTTTKPVEGTDTIPVEGITFNKI